MSGRRAAGSGSVHPWKRRNKATGKVEQVGWCGMIDLGFVDGKRKRQALYAPMDQKKQLEAKVTAAQHAKNSGTAPKGGRLTVAEWLATWLRQKEASGKVRARTLEHYELKIRLHIVPAIGQKPLAKLTPSDVEAMLGAHVKSGMAPRSASHVRAVLRNALQRAERDGLISRNVARLAEAPSVPDEERPALEPEEALAFLQAAEAERLSAMYTVALGVGLRFGEIAGLRWPDVDLDGGVLHVRKALQWIRPRGERAALPHLVEPKSRKSRRSVDLSDQVIEALRRHRTMWLEEKIRLGERWLNEWDLVFTESLGQPLRPREVRDQFQAILVRAGLPHMHFHDLRHSNAALLLNAGVPMKVLAELLGHSSPALTERTYAHVLKPLREQARRAQAGIFGG
jgi:integrase